MADRIEGDAKGQELDKRTYLAGIKIFSECPGCKEEFIKDLGGDSYLSYPKIGEVDEINFWCEECDMEWEVPVILEVTLRLADG